MSSLIRWVRIARFGPLIFRACSNKSMVCFLFSDGTRVLVFLHCVLKTASMIVCMRVPKSGLLFAATSFRISSAASILDAKIREVR